LRFYHETDVHRCAFCPEWLHLNRWQWLHFGPLVTVEEGIAYINRLKNYNLDAFA